MTVVDIDENIIFNIKTIINKKRFKYRSIKQYVNLILSEIVKKELFELDENNKEERGDKND